MRRAPSDLTRCGRRPYASINFVTCHDGFTLRDLVSYNDKHNQANGEENRDGTDDNASWNCGAEGPTDDAAVRALRGRQRRNLMATLLLSQGVPMICAGDELGHSQKGNNNAYCHDGELTWLDWTLDAEGKEYLEFVRHVIALRRSQPVFQRRTFFQGRNIRGGGITDISWISPSGGEMADAAWDEGFVRCLGVRLAGDRIGELNELGERIVGDTLLILLNGHHEEIPFVLPVHQPGQRWERLFDTAVPASSEAASPAAEDRPYALQGRSLAVLRVISKGTAPTVQDTGRTVELPPQLPPPPPVVVAAK